MVDAATEVDRRARRRRQRGLAAMFAAGAVVAGAAVAGVAANRDHDATGATGLVAAETGRSGLAATERTTASGIQLRLHTTDRVPRSSMELTSREDVPPRCQVTGLAQATAIGAAAVATAQTLLHADATDEGTFGIGVSGVLENDPILVVVAHVPGDVVAVTLTAPSGTDTATPVDGLVGLAVAAPEAVALASSAFGDPDVVPSFDSIVVELGRADGSSITISGAELAAGGARAADPACLATAPSDGLPAEAEPVATLPVAGTLPADPAAAEADIRQAVRDAYSIGEAGDARRLAALDDASGVQDMIDLVRADANRRLLEPSALELTDLVFTDTDEASFRYDLTLPGGARFEQQLGRARFVDGRWTISRATLCGDWAKVGADCGP